MNYVMISEKKTRINYKKGSDNLYSWEIDNYIKLREYELSREEYLIASDINSNPQINMIIYDIQNNIVTICTNDGYSWGIKIY